MAAEDWIPDFEEDDWDDYYQPRHSFNRKRTKMKNSRDIHKFYIGAKHIAEAISHNMNDDWTHKSLDAAIQHAKENLESEDSEVVIVVEIVAIIKRDSRPIKVEKLKR